MIPDLALLIGRVLFLVVLYLFVFLVIRSAVKDLRRRPAAVVEAEAAPLVVSSRAVGGAGKPVVAQAPRAPAGAQAAAASDWDLVVVESRVVAPGTVFALPRDRPVFVGRAPDSGIQLRDTFVSSRHARLEATRDGVVIEDLGSTNGTVVDGQEIDRPMVLDPGDRLVIGDTVFVVEVL